MTAGLAREIAHLDALGQAALVHSGELTARELSEAGIAAIEELNPVLNAVITPMFDQALQQPIVGPFTGVPYLLKDLVVEMAGTPFSEGSRFLAGNLSAHDCELVVRLRRAGLRPTRSAVR